MNAIAGFMRRARMGENRTIVEVVAWVVSWVLWFMSSSLS